MRKLLVISLLSSSLSFAQQVPYAAPAATPAPATASAPKVTVECPPPAEETKKKPVPKKVTPKKCPAQKSCPTCETKVETKVEYKYRDRVVNNTPKNDFNILVGIGPHGIVTDYYETKERRDEYAVRKEKDTAKGLVAGVQYLYRISPSVKVGILGLTNETVLFSGGFSW